MTVEGEFQENWEPLMVPSMDLIRKKVAESEWPYQPSSAEWGHGEVFAVVKRRWTRALRESCTHPRGFDYLGGSNLYGEPYKECSRCHVREERLPDASS